MCYLEQLLFNNVLDDGHDCVRVDPVHHLWGQGAGVEPHCTVGGREVWLIILVVL